MVAQLELLYQFVQCLEYSSYLAAAEPRPQYKVTTPSKSVPADGGPAYHSRQLQKHWAQVGSAFQAVCLGVTGLTTPWHHRNEVTQRYDPAVSDDCLKTGHR